MRIIITCKISMRMRMVDVNVESCTGESGHKWEISKVVH